MAKVKAKQKVKESLPEEPSFHELLSRRLEIELQELKREHRELQQRYYEMEDRIFISQHVIPVSQDISPFIGKGNGNGAGKNGGRPPLHPSVEAFVEDEVQKLRDAYAENSAECEERLGDWKVSKLPTHVKDEIIARFNQWVATMPDTEAGDPAGYIGRDVEITERPV